MRVSFKVSFELPRAATIPVARRYVEDAVRMMAGGINEDDPMFVGRFDTATVEVVYLDPKKALDGVARDTEGEHD